MEPLRYAVSFMLAIKMSRLLLINIAHMGLTYLLEHYELTERKMQCDTIFISDKYLIRNVTFLHTSNLHIIYTYYINMKYIS